MDAFSRFIRDNSKGKGVFYLSYLGSKSNRSCPIALIFGVVFEHFMPSRLCRLGLYFTIDYLTINFNFVNLPVGLIFLAYFVIVKAVLRYQFAITF